MHVLVFHLLKNSCFIFNFFTLSCCLFFVFIQKILIMIPYIFACACCCLFVVNTPFISCCKFGSPYLRKTTAAARAAILIPIRVCSISVCPDNGLTASVWDL